ncbi:MAG: TrkA C-terminal domain-containing protein [Phycisphaeraceae bacterium]|nr:TrkA C-terminal domain-containing protein [Phycisphaeraceae bacterium]
MGALLALLVIVIVSLLVVRLGTLALTKTGLTRSTASFQAYSAFFGVGFTTREAELVVNHPVRRRIIRDLIVSGNVGLTGALATLIVTFVQTRGTWETTRQIGWILLGVLTIWLITRFRFVVRFVDWSIGVMLKRMGDVTHAEYELLLRVERGYGVAEVEIEAGHWLVGRTLSEARLTRRGVTILGISRELGGYVGSPHGDTRIERGDVLTVYGREDDIHRELVEGREPSPPDATGSGQAGTSA